MRIAITGHVDVPDDDWVLRTLTDRLREVAAPGWQGITCLAAGADQIFARAVIRAGGSFDVVLPAEDYAQRMRATGHEEPFRDLLRRATDVRTMPFRTSNRDAYLAASDEMLDGCDVLLAVWDGTPSRRKGDTAHVVARARERGLPVEIVWPHGGARTGVRRLTRAAAPDPG